MDFTVAEHVAYLVLGVGLTIWVARTLAKNGRVFLVDAFGGNGELADAVNRLLVVGFYLINVGFVASALKYGEKPHDLAGAIEVQAGDPTVGADARYAALLIADMDGPGGDVAAPRSGYLQYIEHRTLVRIATEKDAVIHVRYRPGHFLVQGHPYATVWPASAADQVARASQMPAGDQQAMIQNMVEGLASRLKSDPRDPNGWVRLMRARMVLNQPDAAANAYHQALKTYADDGAQQAAFKDAARQLGVPGA